MKQFLPCLLGFLLIGSACTKLEPTRDEVRSTLEASTWRIVSLIDNGQDFSSEYQEVQLQFQNRKRVKVIDGEREYEGTWRLRRAFFDDDRQVELDLDFTAVNNRIGRLYEDWYLVEMTADRLLFEFFEEGREERLELQAL